MPASTEENFRDHISTADKEGRRLWVFPTRPNGIYYRLRTILSWFLLAFMAGAPFVKINGEPLLLFDILNRKFIFFSLVFWPQDFHLFVLAVITFIIFIVLFTSVYGRLFCGWICPQTVFMEMVFRKIEYLIEGSAGAQKRLAKAPMSAGKFFKKGLKHSIFFITSFLITNIFLAYIIGVDELKIIVTDDPANHKLGLFIAAVFSFIFYGVFAWFREQACTLVCPYGRLQSVLLDNNSLVISYDYKRGEPRSPIKKGESFEGRGDCIDCHQCVKVCPTGIDIRNGTQLECINCTACIDACNAIMKRQNLPPGLIRYASGNNIEKGEKFRVTPRIIFYSSILSILIIILSVFMLNRSQIEATILRTPGSLYDETTEGIIKNLYTIVIVNKSNSDGEINLKLKTPQGKIAVIGGEITINKNELTEAVFFVEIDKKQIFSRNSMVVIEVYFGDKLAEEITTNFMGP